MEPPAKVPAENINVVEFDKLDHLRSQHKSDGVALRKHAVAQQISNDRTLALGLAAKVMQRSEKASRLTMDFEDARNSTKDTRNEIYKEDIAAWLSALFDIEGLTKENLYDQLANGEMVCRIAGVVHEIGLSHWKYKLRGKEPAQPIYTKKCAPYNFQARANIHNFLEWARKMNIPCVFETNDLMEHHLGLRNSYNVLNCLMDLARGAPNLPVLPKLVQFETQISEEERNPGSEQDSNVEEDIRLAEAIREASNQQSEDLDEPQAASVESAGKGQYWIEGTKLHVRCFNNHIVVRVGGGWDSLENYLASVQKANGVKLDTSSIAAALRSGSSKAEEKNGSGPSVSKPPTAALSIGRLRGQKPADEIDEVEDVKVKVETSSKVSNTSAASNASSSAKTSKRRSGGAAKSSTTMSGLPRRTGPSGVSLSSKHKNNTTTRSALSSRPISGRSKGTSSKLSQVTSRVDSNLPSKVTSRIDSNLPSKRSGATAPKVITGGGKSKTVSATQEWKNQKNLGDVNKNVSRDRSATVTVSKPAAKSNLRHVEDKIENDLAVSKAGPIEISASEVDMENTVVIAKDEAQVESLDSHMDMGDTVVLSPGRKSPPFTHLENIATASSQFANNSQTFGQRDSSLSPSRILVRPPTRKSPVTRSSSSAANNDFLAELALRCMEDGPDSNLLLEIGCLIGQLYYSDSDERNELLEFARGEHWDLIVDTCRHRVPTPAVGESDNETEEQRYTVL